MEPIGEANHTKEVVNCSARLAATKNSSSHKQRQAN